MSEARDLFESSGFFEAQRLAWSRPPVDDVGYVASEDLLAMRGRALTDVIYKFESVRYDPQGWRNYGNLWREKLGLDSTEGKVVLDYGCGVGIEALQFCRQHRLLAPRNRVFVGDIVESNVRLAARVCELAAPGATVHPLLLSCEPPFFPDILPPIDVFYSNGVLHHTPLAREVLERAARALSPDGEVRLMLYSDEAWRKYTGAPLPAADEDVRRSPHFERFVRSMDAVGGYADWYSEEKVVRRFGDILDLCSFDYITKDRSYAVVVMKRRAP